MKRRAEERNAHIIEAFLSGSTRREIADKTGMSYGVVKNIIRRSQDRV